MSVETTVQIKESNRVYLPRNIRERLNVKVGDWIKISIKKDEEVSPKA